MGGVEAQKQNIRWRMDDFRRHVLAPTEDATAAVINLVQQDFPELTFLPAVHSSNKGLFHGQIRAMGLAKNIRQKIFQNLADAKGRIDEGRDRSQSISSVADFLGAFSWEMLFSNRHQGGYYMRWHILPGGQKFMLVHVQANAISAGEFYQAVQEPITDPAPGGIKMYSETSSGEKIRQGIFRKAGYVAAHEIGHGLSDHFHGTKSELYSDGFAALFLAHYAQPLYFDYNYLADRTDSFSFSCSGALAYVAYIRQSHARSQSKRRWEYPFMIMLEELKHNYEKAKFYGAIENCRDLLKIVDHTAKSETTKRRLAAWNNIAKAYAILRKTGLGHRSATACAIKNVTWEQDADFFHLLFDTSPAAGIAAQSRLIFNPFETEAEYKAVAGKAVDGNNGLLAILAAHRQKDLIESFQDWAQLAQDSGWIYAYACGAEYYDFVKTLCCAARGNAESFKRLLDNLSHAPEQSQAKVKFAHGLAQRRKGETAKSLAAQIKKHPFLARLREFSGQENLSAQDKNCILDWAALYAGGLAKARQALLDGNISQVQNKPPKPQQDRLKIAAVAGVRTR